MTTAIKDAVWNVTGIKIESEETSLLDTKLGIPPADFLYIFELLEKNLELPVIDIFRDSNYLVMKLNNLSDAIFELYQKTAASTVGV